MTYLTRQILGLATTLLALVMTIYFADKLGITDEIVDFVDHVFNYRP